MRVAAAALVLLLSAAAAAGTVIGAEPLGVGERVLRLSGGLAAFIPQGAAGVPLLGGTFAPVLPRGSVSVGFGAGAADGFLVYDTVGGWVHALGAEGRLRLVRAGRVTLATVFRLDYEMRGLKVETVSFAGSLRFAGELRGEVRFGEGALVFGGGPLAELVASERVGGEGFTDVRPLLASWEASLGGEWPWGRSSRFFLRAVARFAADPSIQLDRTVIFVEVGAGLPF